MRKFLNVKPIGSKPESVKILLAEEEFFKWNAVQALADKLNVMREEGRNVFDTLYGVTIMGEVRKDPTVTAVDDKVMKILKANCFNREHSPFNFRHVDPKWITIRGAYSEKDYERMAFIETLSGHPLTLMEPPYTSDFFKKLKSSGEEQYIAEVLDAHVGYASVIFDAKKNPEPLTMGGVDRNYDKTAFLDYFSVLRSSQKKGVGKKIINKIESDAKEYGKEVLSLNTPTINTDAVSFYSALGFRVAAVIPDKYASGIDAVLMSKDIAG
jgi:ribosomal protein S18 acetylase RimI-like enzyme